MQQLFGLINEVLAHSPATAKRRLRIATYKVGPISSLDLVQTLEVAKTGQFRFNRMHSCGLFAASLDSLPRQHVVEMPHCSTLHDEIPVKRPFRHSQLEKALQHPWHEPCLTWSCAAQVVPFSPAAGPAGVGGGHRAAGQVSAWGRTVMSGAHRRYARQGDYLILSTATPQSWTRASAMAAPDRGLRRC